jgi:hypothetical protein
MSDFGLTDNRLTLWDEAMVRANRATGRVQMIQVVWVYEHPVNLDEVRRFHRNFGYGMAGRRVERSPLPFGRYRGCPRWARPPRCTSTPIRCRATSSATGPTGGPR